MDHSGTYGVKEEVDDNTGGKEVSAHCPVTDTMVIKEESEIHLPYETCNDTRITNSETEDSEKANFHKKIRLSKQHFCLYCRQKKTHMPRHFNQVHANEKEIKVALSLPPTHKRKLFARLISQGDDIHNKMNPMDQIPAKKSSSDSEKITCPGCKKLLSLRSMSKHSRLCDNMLYTLRKVLKNKAILEEECNNKLSDEANEIAYIKIKNETYKKLIINDTFLVEHLNLLVGKNISENHKKRITSDMKILCEILLLMMDIAREDGLDIIHSGSFFALENYEYFSKAMLQMADAPNAGFQKPGIIYQYGGLFKGFAETVCSVLSKQGNREDFDKAQEWLKMYTTTFPYLFGNDARAQAMSQLTEDRRPLFQPEDQSNKQLYEEKPLDDIMIENVTEETAGSIILSELAVKEEVTDSQKEEDEPKLLKQLTPERKRRKFDSTKKSTEIRWTSTMKKCLMSEFQGEIKSKRTPSLGRVLEACGRLTDMHKPLQYISPNKLRIQVDNIIRHGTSSKQHFCLYCRKKNTHITRHFLQVHKGEEMIRKACTLPPRQKRKLFESLISQGDFIHNKINPMNRIPAKTSSSDSEKITCPSCKKLLSSQSMYKHSKMCKKTLYTLRKVLKTKAILEEGGNNKLSDGANEIAYIKIKNETYKKLIINDIFLVEHLNFLVGKNISENHKKRITSDMEILCEMLLLMMDIAREDGLNIIHSGAFFTWENYEYFNKAMFQMADTSDFGFQKLDIVDQHGRIFKEFVETVCLVFNKEGDEEGFNKAQEWLRMFTDTFSNSLGNSDRIQTMKQDNEDKRTLSHPDDLFGEKPIGEMLESPSTEAVDPTPSEVTVKEEVVSDSQNEDGESESERKRECSRKKSSRIRWTNVLKQCLLSEFKDEIISKRTPSLARVIKAHERLTDLQKSFQNISPQKIKSQLEYIIRERHSPKQHFCLYCRQKRTNMPAHFKQVHADEKDIKKALSLPHIYKRKIFARLIGQGDHIHNNMNPMDQILARKSSSGSEKIVCPSCKKLLTSKTLFRHLKICDIKLYTLRKSVKNVAILEKDCIKLSVGANEIVYLAIKNEAHRELIINDPFLVEHINISVRKDICNTNLKRIRVYMRILCKTLLLMMNIAREDGLNINHSESFFTLENYKYFIKAMLLMAGASDGGFQKPNIVYQYGSVIRRFAETVCSVLSKQRDEEGFNKAQEWLRMHTSIFSKCLGNSDMAEAMRQLIEEDRPLSQPEDQGNMQLYRGKSLHDTVIKSATAEIITARDLAIKEEVTSDSQSEDDEPELSRDLAPERKRECGTLKQSSSIRWTKVMKQCLKSEFQDEIMLKRIPSLERVLEAHDRLAALYKPLQYISSQIIRKQVGSIIQKRPTSKQHFCLYCRLKKTHMSRHFKQVHSEEEEVKRALTLPPNDKRKIFARLISQGDHLHNKINPQDKIHAKKSRSDSEKIVCPSCKKTLTSASFYNHLKFCDNTLYCRRKSLKRKAILENIKCNKLSDNANEIVYFVIRDEAYRNLIITNPFLVEYINYLVDKDVGGNHYGRIASYIRILCRILFLMMDNAKEDGLNIHSDSFFTMENYEYFHKAMFQLAGASDDGFKKPGIIYQYGLIFNRFVKTACLVFRKQGNEEGFNNAQDWLETFSTTFSDCIGSSARKQTIRQHNKDNNKDRRPLPHPGDVLKFTKYIKSNSEEMYKKLLENFNNYEYFFLSKLLLLKLWILNNKRAMEVDRITLVEFQEAEEFDSSSIHFKTLTLTEQMCITSFKRVTMIGHAMRGKLVPLLYPITDIPYYNFLIANRKNAGIHEDNNYLFATGNKYIEISKVMQEISVKCGAICPAALRGRSICQDIVVSLLYTCLNKEDMQQLAQTLGHSLENHLKFESNPYPATHLRKVSKILLAIDEGNVDSYIGKSLDEIVVDAPIAEKTAVSIRSRGSAGNEEGTSDSQNEDDESELPRGFLYKRKRKFASRNKSSPTRWTNAMKRCLMSEFKEEIRLKRTPSLARSLEACERLTDVHKVFQHISPQKIRIQVNNIILKKTKNKKR